MHLALQGGEKDIQVAVIVEVGVGGATTIGDRVAARQARDVDEVTALFVEVELVALETAEGKPLLEELAHVIGLVLLIACLLNLD